MGGQKWYAKTYRDNPKSALACPVERLKCKITKITFRTSMQKHIVTPDCASKVSLSLLFYICIYCFYLGFL
jgi:hypothetical protein